MSDQQPSDTPGGEPSEWQKRITGEWYGAPSVFDPTGTHLGYEKVSRASVFEDGKTIYWMKTQLEGGGPVRDRFELADQFEFSVQDSDAHRLYLGPDFYGAGEPFGGMVDAHYYSPAWKADLKTMVHVLADGETQVYSSLLYEGPTIVAVFNGVYKVAFDYDDNPETRDRIDTFTALEKERGPRPQVLPQKRSGRWTGTLEVYDNQQKPVGEAQVTIEHRPLDLVRAEQQVTVTGAVEHSWKVVRNREGNLTTFHGPDAWGNGRTWGRAMYPSYHLLGTPTKVKGREFLIDAESGEMSVVWQFAQGEVLEHAAFGLLQWEEA